IFLDIDDFDVLLLQRGDYFPIELINAVDRPKFFWASEPVVSCRDHDNLLVPGLFDHVFVHTNRCRRIVTSDLKILEPDKVSCLINGFDENVQYWISGSEKDIDVLFVGNMSARRRNILDRLSLKYNILQTKAYGTEMTELFNRAKIVLNLHTFDNLDTETRIFEGLGCGSFVISERLSADNPFTNGVHLVETESIDELEEKIGYYLLHEEEREAIANNGYNEALANHTYTARAIHIADVMGKYSSGVDKSVPAINKNKVLEYISGGKVLALGKSMILERIMKRLDDGVDEDYYLKLLIDMLNSNKYQLNELIASISHTKRKDQILNNIAVQLFISGSHRMVIPLLTRSFEINDANMDTVYNIGFVLNEYGQKERALDFLEKFKNTDEGISELIKKICNANT
ncbi:MAG: glycosyltransferase family 1 protein, partial [Clostridiaceae bacterium]|nr:glycosyltransferase family 1 protein [Clostridiaceae bacterium]